MITTRDIMSKQSYSLEAGHTSRNMCSLNKMGEHFDKVIIE
jgi:hypothetical protein